MTKANKPFNKVKQIFLKIKKAVRFVIDSLQNVHDRKSPVYFILAILLVAAGIKVCVFDLTSERVLHHSDSIRKKPKISKPITKPVVKQETKSAKIYNNL